MTDRELVQPCKTGAQCIGGKCPQCEVREWVGLTDEERYEIYDKQDGFYFALLEIEAKLKEKNS